MTPWQIPSSPPWPRSFATHTPTSNACEHAFTLSGRPTKSRLDGRARRALARRDRPTARVRTEEERMSRLPTSPDALVGLRAARWIRESTPGQFDRYGPEAQAELQDVAIRRLVWQTQSSSGGRPAAVARIPQHRDGRHARCRAQWRVRRSPRGIRFPLAAQPAPHPRTTRRHPPSGSVAVWFADEEILSSCDRHWDQLVDEPKTPRDTAEDLLDASMRAMPPSWPSSATLAVTLPSASGATRPS